MTDPQQTQSFVFLFPSNEQDICQSASFLCAF